MQVSLYELVEAQRPSGSWEAKLMARGTTYQKNFDSKDKAIRQRELWEAQYGY